MPEILLPTASKQDSIKKTVEDIAGNFPISGGTDFSKIIPIKSGAVLEDRDNYIELINIEGKGLIHKINFYNYSWTSGAYGYSTSSKLIIIVDGYEYEEITHTGNGDRNISDLLSIPFMVSRESIKILAKRSGDDTTYKPRVTIYGGILS